MRWLQAGVIVLSALVMTGCPSEFGKEGRIAKAVRKDMQETLIIRRCSPERRQEVCQNGQENSDACRQCGGPP
jgi:hypothetical protein